MGMKRPLEEEDFPEPSFRQAKQRDYNGKLTLNAEDYHITTPAVQSPGEANNSFCELQFEQLDDCDADDASVADKELEASAPLSLVTSSSSEEDAVLGGTSNSSSFPGYIDFNIPRRLPGQFDYPYISLLNSPPRKEVPLGPDHQAEVPQFEQLDDCDADNASVTDNLEASAPLSLVTSSSSEEDAVIGGTSNWSSFPGYIDFNIPRCPPSQYDDPYISMLNSPPRKEVPLGADHQAEVPLWDTNASQMNLSGSSYFVDYLKRKSYLFDGDKERLVGTCIIAMPDLNDSTMEGVGVGRGRTDCSCLDMGSMRCVQQHVKEAREKIRETIGDVNFAELGLCGMGDEVSNQWTPHDEQVFHDVVYSNPASHGRRFWKHLSAAFPTRTKNELVSYYFNVFMLQRRAVQNRSYLLDIDSDDDEELRGVHGGSYQNRSYPSDLDTDIDDRKGHDEERYFMDDEEDEDSTVESFGDEDLDASWVDDFWSEPQSGCGAGAGDGDGDEASKLNHGASDGKEAEKQDAVEMNARTAETISGGEDDDPRSYS